MQPLYIAPPEVAALQSTIAQLQAEKELMLRGAEVYKERIAELESGRGEPVAYMYQHDETGLIGFVHAQQLERGWQRMNPRLIVTGPLFTAPPAPVAVVLPDRKPPTIHDTDESMGFDEGWNACLDATAALNGERK